MINYYFFVLLIKISDEYNYKISVKNNFFSIVSLFKNRVFFCFKIYLYSMIIFTYLE